MSIFVVGPKIPKSGQVVYIPNSEPYLEVCDCKGFVRDLGYGPYKCGRCQHNPVNHVGDYGCEGFVLAGTEEYMVTKLREIRRKRK